MPTNTMKGVSTWMLLVFWVAFVIAATQGQEESPSRKCQSLWVGGLHEDVGLICMELTSEYESGNNAISYLLISYEVYDDWQIHESFLWLGTDLKELPQIQSTGQPLLEEFSFTNVNVGGENTYEMTVPLNQTGMSCLKSAEERVYAAFHPVLTRKKIHFNQNITVDQEKTKISEKKSSFLRSKDISDVKEKDYRNKKGLWWMEFELSIDCGTPTQQRQQKSWQPIIKQPILRSLRSERRLFEFKRRDPIRDSCPSSASYISEPNNLMTEDFLFHFHVASMFALGVSFDRNLMEKIDYFKSFYERFSAFDDGLNDAAIVAKVDGTCYAAFRGTVEYSLPDVAQNFVLGFRKVPGTDCYVRRGYYDCYFTNYQEAFEQEIRDCVDSCEDGRCPLIVTGASQGAATSVVASLRLFQEYDPYVFTFGVPRTFLPTSPFEDHLECTHFNEERQYHFVLTDSLLKVFDPTPYYHAFWTKNIGREILFDGDGNFNDQGIASNYIMRREPTSLAIHTRWNYNMKTRKAYENACLPAPSRGWFDGHWCAEDGDCQAKSYCREGYCVPRYDTGEACDRDGECRSEHCGDDGICLDQEKKKLAAAGDKCNSDEDCSSQRCEGWLWFSRCEERQETGAHCNEHSDCLSGHCAGLINGKCL